MDNATTLNMKKLYQMKSLLDEVQAFVKNVYLPDVIAIGSMYADWLGYGAGIKDYLAVPDMPLDTAGTQFDMPGGTIFNGDLGSFKAITKFGDEYLRDNIQESIAHSWYDGDWQKHPWEEETVPKYTDWDDDGDYSWVKAPRFDGKPMQVGPLAQVLMGLASGDERFVKYGTYVLEQAGKLAGAELTPAVLHSTLGRHAARCIRAVVLSDLAQEHWGLLANNIAGGDTDIFNAPVFPKGEQRGFGFHEAPRGFLSHWIVIQDGKIANYQAVVPSTWNAGPRDAKGQIGPYEASLLGNPVADPDAPLEVIRTIHSFDPCLACAIHTHDAEGNEITKVKAL